VGHVVRANQFFIAQVHQQAANTGEVRTFYGRRRYLPNIYSTLSVDVAEACRHAVNTIVQGSAADLTKMALIRLSDALPDNVRMFLAERFCDKMERVSSLSDNSSTRTCLGPAARTVLKREGPAYRVFSGRTSGVSAARLRPGMPSPALFVPGFSAAWQREEWLNQLDKTPHPSCPSLRVRPLKRYTGQLDRRAAAPLACFSR
jgi:hypothetical protein